MSEALELVLDLRAALGEGPVWDDRAGLLYFVDITGKKVHVYDPQKKTDRVIEVGQQIGCLVLREQGGALAGLEGSIVALDLTTGAQTPFAQPERHLPNNRFNDGKCDPAGRFWIGSMAMKGPASGAGSLYRVDHDGSVAKMFGGATISNGLAWSADARTMYYIDTPTHQVVAYDADPATGAIANRRVAVTIPDGGGGPDGMTIDAEGMLWVAQWGGWQVGRYDPRTGRLIQAIPVPAANVTCPTFAGPGLDELYITTARQGIAEDDARQPHAGGLFRCRPGVKGTPVSRFKG
jgi:sugar lactone lactonase YvrE